MQVTEQEVCGDAGQDLPEDSRALLDAVVAISSDLDLHSMLDRLVVSEAYVNDGPRMKRVRPAPMGRAYRYQRRLAHIVIKVTEKEA